MPSRFLDLWRPSPLFVVWMDPFIRSIYFPTLARGEINDINPQRLEARDSRLRRGISAMNLTQMLQVISSRLEIRKQKACGFQIMQETKQSIDTHSLFLSSAQRSTDARVEQESQRSITSISPPSSCLQTQKPFVRPIIDLRYRFPVVANHQSRTKIPKRFGESSDADKNDWSTALEPAAAT